MIIDKFQGIVAKLTSKMDYIKNTLIPIGTSNIGQNHDDILPKLLIVFVIGCLTTTLT